MGTQIIITKDDTVDVIISTMLTDLCDRDFREIVEYIYLAIEKEKTL